jgi:hypothetical protein
MYTESVGKPKVNERFKHNDMYAMLDIAAGYSSTQHQAANQMWSDEQDLYDYLKSDHIPKKYHKDFYNDVKRRFKGVNESVNEATKEQEAVAFRIKLLLRQGKFATVSMGEKKLYKLSEAFENWLIDNDDNKYEGITAHLDMAIELIQERENKEAVPHMNKFNKACGKALSRLK